MPAKELKTIDQIVGDSSLRTIHMGTLLLSEVIRTDFKANTEEEFKSIGNNCAGDISNLWKLSIVFILFCVRSFLMN